MQKTTRRRGDDRCIHIDPSHSDTCETGGTSYEKFKWSQRGEPWQSERLWSTQTCSNTDQEHPDPKTERDTETQNGSHEAPATRKRSAETDAERLEEEVTTAEADSERRLALKRKAEGVPDDPNEPQVEDFVMNSVAISWHREKRPTEKIEKWTEKWRTWKKEK